MIWQTVSTSSEDTEQLGEQLGSLLNGGEVIELKADLGGGKTTFVRGLARGFGSADIATSPTFTLSKIYQNNKHQTIYHYDFYRLSDAGIMSDSLAESISDPTAVTVIEWGDIVADILPKTALAIAFVRTPDNADQRQITISYPETLAPLIEKLENNRVVSKS